MSLFRARICRGNDSLYRSFAQMVVTEGKDLGDARKLLRIGVTTEGNALWTRLGISLCEAMSPLIKYLHDNGTAPDLIAEALRAVTGVKYTKSMIEKWLDVNPSYITSASDDYSNRVIRNGYDTLLGPYLRMENNNFGQHFRRERLE